MADDALVVVLCTVPNESVAEELATGLIEASLAACVNVLPGVRSYYRWQGRLERDEELQLIIKTRADRFEKVAAWIGQHHPYDVPEVVQLSVSDASKAYGAWVAEQAAETHS